jgi:FkbM family methyltransferase
MIVELPDHNLKFDIRKKYDTDSIVVKEMFEDNVYEVHGWHFENEDGVVIDIGANIGSFSIQAAWLGATEIFAIEPEPHNLRALKKNIKLNEMQKLIKPVAVGISDFNGVAIISDEGGDSTILDNKDGSEIEVMSLDSFIKKNNITAVQVLKIDTEGSEVETILGASRESLDMCKYIAIEFDKRTGNRLGDIVVKLSETHHVRTMGSWERGGMIFANRY